MRIQHALVWVSVSFVGLVACGGGSGSPSSSGGGGAGATMTTVTMSTGGAGGAPSLHGECASTEQIGYFYVENEIDYSVVSGEVLDGVVPSKILFEVGKEGTCTLWQRKNPFCSPSCAPNEACTQEGTCVPYPLPQDVGQVSITGLTKPVLMTYPSYYDTTVDHPPFTPGAAITLVAHGAAYPGFTLLGQGFAPMVIPAETLVLKKGQALDVTWTPDDSAENADVRIRINVDQHGNSPVELVCDVADTGATVVPVSLIDQLIGFGVTGFPSIHVIRHTLDSVDAGKGCVELEVFSHRLGDLQVADHIPCDGTHPCPGGTTCDIPTGTCK